MRKLELIGQRFDRLTVIDKYSDSPKTRWNCVCDCGTALVVTGSALTSSHTRSCGCYSKEVSGARFKIVAKTLKINEHSSAMNCLYNQYKHNAKHRGLIFELTRAELFKLTGANCTYCGCIPAQTVRFTAKYDSEYTYNGIDRVNSVLGYIIENCVTCCKTCNYAKRCMSTDEFRDWVDRVHANIHRESCHE